MLRQLHVFLKKDLIFTHTYAMAIGDEEMNNIKKLLGSFLEIPMPGKTFQLPGSNFQIFHRSSGNLLFLFITDLIDNKDYIENILIRTIDKFQSLFPEIESVDPSKMYIDELVDFLNTIQHNMHSKIAIMGPYNSGKTTLYNILKDDNERSIVDFAKVSDFSIKNLKFDLWDFQLPENYHGLWSKFIKGSDLILLLFDLSNYNLKVIEHFLQLYNQESKLSKLLIVGNKADLVDEEELKSSSNLLDIGKFSICSLKRENVKQEILSLIASALGLKRKLPENFDDLVLEAERYEKNRNYVLALAKYKEIIKICNEYQDFFHITNFKNKLNQIKENIKESKESRIKEGKKLKFEIPDQIKFHKKVSVRPLPSGDQQELIKPVPPKRSFIEMPLESEYEKKKVKSLTLFTPADKEKAQDKDILENEDFTVDVELGTKLEETKIQIEEESISSDYPKKLQSLIKKYGSSLSLKLCEHLIKELKKTLARPLTDTDIEQAAQIFVNQEKL